MGAINATCNGTSEAYYNDARQYNQLNQLSEIDTRSRINGYPVPRAGPSLG